MTKRVVVIALMGRTLMKTTWRRIDEMMKPTCGALLLLKHACFLKLFFIGTVSVLVSM
jgi:hypothetical protein